MDKILKNQEHKDDATQCKKVKVYAHTYERAWVLIQSTLCIYQAQKMNEKKKLKRERKEFNIREEDPFN